MLAGLMKLHLGTFQRFMGGNVKSAQKMLFDFTVSP